MRVRTIMTVALLSAGCGTSGSTRSAPDTRATTSATTAAAPTAAPAAPAGTTVTAVPAPIAASSTAAPAARLTPMQLEQLAGELRSTEPAQVAARAAHFRPLCDAEGYPLVGNLATKSANPPKPIAEFCAGVRSSAR